MKFIDEVEISHKTVLLRVDFNVALNPNYSIADDARIRQSLPTINLLLKNHNRLILIAHLGEPKKRSSADSLVRIAKRLQEYISNYKVILIDDFLKDKEKIANQKSQEIIMLENIRFYEGEMKNDPEFSKQLASLADVYVNDAFSVCHRVCASIVGLPHILPSYGGILLKKEITMLGKVMEHPKKPFVAIIGGKKITTKIKFIDKLVSVADFLLLAGGLANTFLVALGHHMGKSIISEEDIHLAKHILSLAKHENTRILLPTDVVVAYNPHAKLSGVKRIDDISEHEQVLDIGPETQAEFAAVIEKAKTIIWNGPVGYMENPVFKRGTDFLYYVIVQNNEAVSVVGGGDTLAAISEKEYLDKITHISTGGGAMLEFIENGTLPGIEALKRAHTS